MPGCHSEASPPPCRSQIVLSDHVPSTRLAMDDDAVLQEIRNFKVRHGTLRDSTLHGQHVA